MNENIDLTKILKDCPIGTKLYTPLAGEVTFEGVYKESTYPIEASNKFDDEISFDSKGRYFYEFNDSECLIFPSKENRDWSKFKAPWYKNEKFDPKTLKAFDRVLVRCFNNEVWRASYFSHVLKNEDGVYCVCINNFKYIVAIPYNEDTKHLLGTKDEPTEYYRYWDD